MRSVRILFTDEDIELVDYVYEQLTKSGCSFLCPVKTFKRYMKTTGSSMQWLCVDKRGWVFRRSPFAIKAMCSSDEYPIKFTEIPLHSLINQENV